jgi:fatty acid-binding protein DegV
MAILLKEVKPAAEAGRPLAYGHAHAPALLNEFIDSVGVEGRFVAEIGGVVGAHVGPGAYGVAYL